jgi:hypothetical protein
MKFYNENGELKPIFNILFIIIVLICWKYYFDNFEKITFYVIVGVAIIACLNDWYKEIFLKPSDVRDKTPNTKVDKQLMIFLKYWKYYFLATIILYYIT